MAFLKGNGKNLRVMTFNIREAKPDDGKFGWENRKEAVSSFLRFHKADIMGLQEVLYSQLKDLDYELNEEYKWIGVGRDGNNNGEFCPILYKRQALELLNQGTFWLSETPELPGSKCWESTVPRVCTWGCFKIKREKDQPKPSLRDSQGPNAGIQPFAQVFYVFNTHLDATSEESRNQSVRLILQKMQNITRGNFPVFFTVDLNASLESSTAKILTENAPLQFKETKGLSVYRPRGPKATYIGFSRDNAKIVDHIFVYSPSHHSAKIMDHAVLTDVEEDNFPLSDHRAVIADAFLMNIQETKREEIVKFSVNYNTSPGEDVYVVGSIPELGSWNAQNAKKLQWSEGNNWFLELRLKKAQNFEYKYVVINFNNKNSRWEQTANRKVEDIFKFLDLNDSWEILAK